MLQPPDVVQHRFSSALYAGEKPRLEEYLSSVDDSERMKLFRKCVELQLNYCRQSGTPFDKEELSGRFPQFNFLLDEICRTAGDSANQSFGSTVFFKRGEKLSDDDDGFAALPGKPLRAGRYVLEKGAGRLAKCGKPTTPNSIASSPSSFPAAIVNSYPNNCNHFWKKGASSPN